MASILNVSIVEETRNINRLILILDFVIWRQKLGHLRKNHKHTNLQKNLLDFKANRTS